MATSFAATALVPAHNTGLRMREATYKLQMPSAWTAAGVAWDLSDDFTEVFSVEFQASGAVTDHQNKYAVIGTFGTYGLTASTVSIVAHQQESDGGGSATDPLVSVPDSDDLSAINDMVAVVKGYKA